VATLCVAVVAAACDESFEPLAPTDLAFSVFGYLDASADTQWIRVMPIRPLKVTSEDSLAATVAVEEVGTGRIIEFQDSLFNFSSYSDQDVGSAGEYVHNFWTTEPIEPGAAYRFTATRTGKDPAEAEVEIPQDYGVEVAIDLYSGFRESDSLRVTGVKYLPFVTTVTRFYDDCGSSLARMQYNGRSADNNTSLIAIGKPLVSSRPGCGVPMVENRELWIVGSESAWPVGGYSPSALGEGGWTSNVTNAVGFLGGVLTKVLPYEDCKFVRGSAPVPHYCRLRYGPETATVTGTITETSCGDGPVDSVTVQLTELDQDPARIRSVLSTRAGEFEIGALEPGSRHLVWARGRQIPVDSVFDLYRFRYVYTKWADAYTIHTDTLTFTPGQQVEYDIELQRLTPCGQPPPGGQ